MSDSKTLILTSISFDMLDGISLPSAFDADEAGLWLASVALQECKVIEELQYVFCNDSYLIDINQEYLSHDTFTDIITFPYKTDPIQAEIYISLDRVNENALLYNGGNLMLELYRVLVHGLLHMCGYDDSSDVDKKNMRNLEDYYVSMRPGDSF